MYHHEQQKMSSAIVLLILLLCTTTITLAFQPPLVSIGSLLFPVRGRTIEYISNVAASEKRSSIQDASDFFVQSFWTQKVGGGARQLTKQQQQVLNQSQLAEFTKRYGGSNTNNKNRRQSELLVCKNPMGEIIACAGVEVYKIPNGYLKGPILTKAPLMSNLAVSRNYRRRGLAEELVKAVEELVLEQWGYDECYLYVEQRNRGAVKLYQKLGYRQIWADADAMTLLPSERGDLQNCPTVILCMRKKLKGESLWSKLLGQ
jgi:RimJ/RimL family protein N-acetyltransferase